MLHYLALCAALACTMLLAGCEIIQAKAVRTQVTIDKDGNRIEETLWRYPKNYGGEEVWITDVFPPGSNERRRTEPRALAVPAPL
jgi:hypothetical protein